MKEKIIEILNSYFVLQGTSIDEFIAEDIEKLLYAEIKKRDKLIKLLSSYSKFLSKTLNRNTTFLLVHGITASDKDIKTEEKFRSDINRLIKQVKKDK